MNTTAPEDDSPSFANGYAQAIKDAAEICEDTRNEAAKWSLPQMAIGASKCRDEILALSPPPTIGGKL